MKKFFIILLLPLMLTGCVGYDGDYGYGGYGGGTITMVADTILADITVVAEDINFAYVSDILFI